MAWGLDPNDPSDALDDPDNDGVINFDELLLNLDIYNPDTDGDGQTDGDEFEQGAVDIYPQGDVDELTTVLTPESTKRSERRTSRLERRASRKRTPRPNLKNSVISPDA